MTVIDQNLQAGFKFIVSLLSGQFYFLLSVRKISQLIRLLSLMVFFVVKFLQKAYFKNIAKELKKELIIIGKLVIVAFILLVWQSIARFYVVIDFQWHLRILCSLNFHVMLKFHEN